jgi:hypothetical protein
MSKPIKIHRLMSRYVRKVRVHRGGGPELTL